MTPNSTSPCISGSSAIGRVLKPALCMALSFLVKRRSDPLTPILGLNPQAVYLVIRTPLDTTYVDLAKVGAYRRDVISAPLMYQLESKFHTSMRAQTPQNRQVPRTWWSP